MRVELAGVAGRQLAGDVAGHLDVAAEREQRQAVVGVAAAPAEQAGAEADREGLNANTAELGNGEMPELVHEHHNAEHDAELNQDRKKMHSGLGKTSAGD